MALTGCGLSITVGEADASWGFEPDHGHFLVPTAGVRVEGRIAVVDIEVRSVFSEETNQRGAGRSTVEPDHDWVCQVIAL